MSALSDLKEYAMALQELAIIEQQMEALGITGAPSGVRGTSTRLPGTNNRTAAVMQQLDGLEELLKRQCGEIQRKVLAGEQALAAIKYARARVIMRSYYVLRMSDEQIAEEIGISRSTVQRIRKATERDMQ